MTLQVDAEPYGQLRQSVVSELSDGGNRARKVFKSKRLQTYWKVGALLVDFLEDADNRYGEGLVRRLAADIEIDLRLLYEIIEFRRRIESLALRPILSWSHYRRLIRIGDAQVRNRYLQAAEASGWSVRQLEAQISEGAFDPPTLEEAPSANPAPQLIAKRGEPWTYRVEDRPGLGRVLDLGFCIYETLEGLDTTDLGAGTLVQTQKSNNRYRVVPYSARRRPFAYRAVAGDVIDGDTLWITVDCGFGTHCDQKIRLRGIDAPEAGRPSGLRARDHVVQALLSVSEIVVTTSKLDRYNRYLADVFYLPDSSDVRAIASEGTFLNRELVEAGLARPWAETPMPW